MLSSLYRDTILFHARHPQNYGRLENPTKTVNVANPLCGDRMIVDVALKNETIERIGWEGEGCILSRAGMSLLSKEVVGKNKEDILVMDDDSLYSLFGIEVTPSREKCVSMSLDGLKQVLA